MAYNIVIRATAVLSSAIKRTYSNISSKLHFQKPDMEQTKLLKLSSLDQFMIRGTVRQILCFPVKNSSLESEIVATLQYGLDKTVAELPFLAGYVRKEEGTANNSVEVVYRHGDSVKLKVKDLKDLMMPYQKLAALRMPMSELRAELVSPMPNMPDPTRDKHEVIAVQANFINGGLLLSICIHHSVFDGIGFGNVIKILANNCQSVGELDTVAVRTEHLDRTALTHGLQPTEPPCALPMLEIKNQIIILENPKDIPVASMLFHFTAPKLAQLKRAATPHRSSSATAWISTNDALCAFLWQRITLARSLHLSPTISTKLTFAINGRPRLTPPLRQTYLGNVALNNYTHTPDIRTLISQPLSTTALAIRSALNAVTPNYIRTTISYINSVRDVNLLKPCMHNILGPDLFVSSWAEFGVYEADFGRRLGKCEWVRCPWRALDGTVKILPKRIATMGGGDEGLEVNVELRKDDLDRLVGDPVWEMYAGEGIV
ncbi:MAG: hypothetical protein M1834_003257 [Cirrosporium novae-zelandiae]|nr:MAG: hypothetical protein M1834_003257 [Cirrosporium novae-zelandiae]